MSAYVPPHLRNKAPAAAPAAAPARSFADRGRGPAAAPPSEGRGGAWGAAPSSDARGAPAAHDARNRPAPQGRSFDAPPRSGADDARDAMRAAAARFAARDVAPAGGRDDARGGDARGGGGFAGRDDARAAPAAGPAGRYVSAYEESRNAAPLEQIGSEDDERTQYAKLIEFSRYRREALGMTREAAQRDGGGRDSGSKPRRQSAPRAFGTNDHGRGMEAEDDVAGGERCDDEGMVYAMHVDGPPCIYFCDRFRRYRFFAKHAGLALLKGLVAANCRNLDANAVLFSDDAEEANRQRAEGYALYEEKPNLRRVGTEIGTWSDGEYGLPGFQWMYLRLKSFQRFTETWALLERCAAAGLFDADASLCLGGRGADKLRVVSLGGGPGYELLAYDWFDRCFDAVASGKAVDMAAAAQARAKDWAALAERRPDEAAADFASLDLQPSWDTYVHSLDYGFTQWDVHADGADSAVVGDSDRVVCMLSNIMCYCTDDQTAELFAKLLCGGRVKAILGNERGAEQRIIPKLERLGIVVVRLLDQANAGRDDRQFAFLPPRSKLPRPRNLPLADDFVRIFPNVPYEEKKGVKTM